MSYQKHTFTYQSYDGYAGGSRPLHCSVFESDILDCDTLEQAIDLVADCIQEDFVQKVSPGWNEQMLRAEVAEIFAKKATEDGE